MEIFMGKVSTPKPNGFADHYPEKKMAISLGI